MSSNGVISFPSPFLAHIPRRFPRPNRCLLLCPFWDDFDLRQGGNISVTNTTEYHQEKISRVAQLILEVLGYTFHPISVFTATWDQVPSYRARVSFFSPHAVCKRDKNVHNSCHTTPTPSSVHWSLMDETPLCSFSMRTISWSGLVMVLRLEWTEGTG